jgi:NAD(P)-dependent dehydrogenase (short-subunit alcohol dehydrogenase family)
MIQTNLTGAFLTSREVTKMMLQNGGGRIINIILDQ